MRLPVAGIRKAMLAAALGAIAIAGQAAELRSISVELEDGHYHLSSETLFEVGRDELYAVLTDYDQFQKFTSAIVASHNVPPDADGRPGFYTRMEGCVLFWCRTFERKGRLLLRPKHLIVAISDPEESDFEYSRERWQLSNADDGTLMIYDFEMKPRFWVPPLIGPYFIKRALKSGGIRAVNRIEALARGEEPTF